MKVTKYAVHSWCHVTFSITLSNSVCCAVCRKVKDESATGSSTTNRVRTVLTISVENIEFDTASCELRLKGRNIQENQFVKVCVSFRPNSFVCLIAMHIRAVCFHHAPPTDGSLSHHRPATEPEVHACQAGVGLCCSG